MPGTIASIGYILSFNKPPLLLQGTAAIIVILFIFRNAPVGTRAGGTPASNFLEGNTVAVDFLPETLHALTMEKN